MKYIKIGIPEKTDWLRYWEIVKFKVGGGFKCDTCNTRSNFQQVRFESEVHGKQLMFENHVKNQCPECVLVELQEHAKHVYNHHGSECRWCEEKKPTASWIRHSKIKSQIIFGGSWWNGHNICQECLEEGIVKRGKDFSSVREFKNGKTYYRNELGLLIERK